MEKELFRILAVGPAVLNLLLSKYLRPESELSLAGNADLEFSGSVDSVTPGYNYIIVHASMINSLAIAEQISKAAPRSVIFVVGAGLDRAIEKELLKPKYSNIYATISLKTALVAIYAGK